MFLNCNYDTNHDIWFLFFYGMNKVDLEIYYGGKKSPHLKYVGGRIKIMI